MDPHEIARMSVDEALDREIQHALAVDHSPELLMRIRRGVDTEPGRGASLRWMFAGSAALASCVVVTVFMTQPERQKDPRVVTARPLRAAMSMPAPVTPAAMAATLGTATGRRASEPGAMRRVSPPEVLISPGEATALRAAVAAIAAGRIDAAQLDTTAVFGSMQTLAIEPLRIEPLPPLALLEGERP